MEDEENSWYSQDDAQELSTEGDLYFIQRKREHIVIDEPKDFEKNDYKRRENFHKSDYKRNSYRKDHYQRWENYPKSPESNSRRRYFNYDKFQNKCCLRCRGTDHDEEECLAFPSIFNFEAYQKAARVDGGKICHHCESEEHLICPFPKFSNMKLELTVNKGYKDLIMRFPQEEKENTEKVLELKEKMQSEEKEAKPSNENEEMNHNDGDDFTSYLNELTKDVEDTLEWNKEMFELMNEQEKAKKGNNQANQIFKGITNGEIRQCKFCYLCGKPHDLEVINCTAYVQKRNFYNPFSEENKNDRKKYNDFLNRLLNFKELIPDFDEKKYSK